LEAELEKYKKLEKQTHRPSQQQQPSMGTKQFNPLNSNKRPSTAPLSRETPSKLSNTQNLDAISVNDTRDLSSASVNSTDDIPSSERVQHGIRTKDSSDTHFSRQIPAKTFTSSENNHLEEFRNEKLLRLQKKNELQTQRINKLSKALALARAYPLLQQRSDDELFFPELIQDQKNLNQLERNTIDVKFVSTNLSVQNSENESIILGMDEEELKVAKELKKSSTLDDISKNKLIKTENNCFSPEEKVHREIREKKVFGQVLSKNNKVERKGWFD